MQAPVGVEHDPSGPNRSELAIRTLTVTPMRASQYAIGPGRSRPTTAGPRGESLLLRILCGLIPPGRKSGSGEVRVETFDIREVCDDTGDSVPNESQDVDNGFIDRPPIARPGGSKYDSDIIGSKSDVLNLEVITDLSEGTAHVQHFVCAHEAARHAAADRGGSNVMPSTEQASSPARSTFAIAPASRIPEFVLLIGCQHGTALLR